MSEQPNGNGTRLSLAELAAQSQDSEIRTATARAGSDNPFIERVRESHDKDRAKKDSGWKEIKVPSTMLDELIASMRSLSAYFGETGEKIGVHLRIEFLPDGTQEWQEVGPGRFDEIPRDGRECYFKYTGRDRMKRGRRRQQPTAQQPAAGQATPEEEPEHADESELTPA